MFAKIASALGMGGAQIKGESSTALQPARLRAILNQSLKDAELKYLSQLPSKDVIDKRAREIADKTTSTIVNRLEENATKHGWNFAIIELLPLYAAVAPGEHQALLRAAPLIVAWCKKEGLAAHVSLSPVSPTSHDQIEKIAVHVSF